MFSTRELRELAGMEQAELARLIGLNKSTLSRHETGQKRLSARRQELISAVLRKRIAQRVLAGAAALEAIDAALASTEGSE